MYKLYYPYARKYLSNQSVLACYFFKFLESGPSKSILHPNYYFRYIDDILIICPDDILLPDFVDRLNSVEPRIDFTFEINKTLHFLDSK